MEQGIRSDVPRLFRNWTTVDDSVAVVLQDLEVPTSPPASFKDLREGLLYVALRLRDKTETFEQACAAARRIFFANLDPAHEVKVEDTLEELKERIKKHESQASEQPP